MKTIEKINFTSNEEKYKYMNRVLTSYVCDGEYYLSSLSNAAAILWMFMDDINWAGFYLYRNDELVLGTFQGKPACTHIAVGKGVCGTAALTRETQLVKNVHEFPGHIACDSASNSEIVIPIIKDSRLIGVLDIDSPSIERFDEVDKKYLEQFVDIILKFVKFPDSF